MPGVTVVGGGALGAYLAVKVAAARIVVRAARKGQLQRHGLKVLGAETHAGHPPVVSSEELKPLDGPVFVAVKATDLKEALTVLKPRLTTKSPVVLCQSGIGIVDEAKTQIPAELLVRAACWLAVASESPGVVRVSGVVRVELAGPRAREITPVLKGLQVRDVQDVQICEWRKALWSLAVNGPCSIADAPDGAVLESAHLRRLSDRLLAEATEVARAEGVGIGPKECAEAYESIKAAAGTANPTLQDLRAGRRTEVLWLHGAVSRLGRKRGVATPYNDFVTSMIAHLEQRKRPEAKP